MKNILVIGGGKIGSVVAELLVDTPEAGGYSVTVADHSAATLARIDADPQRSPRLTTLLLDVTDPAQLSRALQGQFAVLSAAPYHLTLHVAKAAKAAGVHYLDLTEDVASTRAIRALAADATTAFIPQCGLPPVSSRSWPPIWHASSTRSTRCACASARCPPTPATR